MHESLDSNICAELRDDLVLPTSHRVKSGKFARKWDINVRVGFAAFVSGVNVTGLVQCLGQSGIRATRSMFQGLWSQFGEVALKLATDNYRRMRLQLAADSPADIIWVKCKATGKIIRMLKVQISLDGAGKN